MQNDYKEELIERFVESAEHLNRRKHSGRLDEWQGLDMTISQIKTLVLLEYKGPLRMGAIAKHLGSALSATTTIMDRLVEKELVERISDPNDRRAVICELTDPGRKVLERFWRIGRNRIVRVIDLLEVEQLETAVSGLELIRWAEDEAQRRFDSM